MEVSSARGSNRPVGSIPTGSGTSLVGLQMVKDLRRGPVDFRGKRIANLEDLAAISQILRDPKLETLRFVYTKGNTIVGHKVLRSFRNRASRQRADWRGRKCVFPPRQRGLAQESR